MNPTQLRILFDAWSRRSGQYTDNQFGYMIVDLIEAGGFPRPGLGELDEARDSLRNAVEMSYETQVSDVWFAKYEKLTADWTVTP